MAKQTKMPTDLNQRAKAIVDLATSSDPVPDPDEDKDPAVVALGRKGGKARAEKMNPAQRTESAKRAVNARWKDQ
jgi:hypothetical protein